MSGSKSRYLIRYKLWQGSWHPIVRLALRHRTRIIKVEAYVDSGALYSIFDVASAEHLGLDYRSGRLIWVTVGDGGNIPVYLHRLRFLFGRLDFPATVGFSDRLGVGFNLLGRKDIFERLSFTFNDYHHFLLVSDARDVAPEVLARLKLLQK